MKRIGSKSEDKRIFVCPQCDKPRMSRPLLHVVSNDIKEYKISETETVKLFIDICDSCKARNSREFFEPKRDDVKRLMKAIKEQKPIEDKSIEDML